MEWEKRASSGEEIKWEEGAISRELHVREEKLGRKGEHHLYRVKESGG